MSDHPKRNGDAIDQAIEAQAEPVVIQMQEHLLTIRSTNRPFKLTFPVDITEKEILEVVGWMGTDMRLWVQQREAKGPAGRIVIPAGVRLT